MASDSGELLVIMSEDSAGAGAGFLHRYPIVQAASPFVFSIALPADAGEAEVAALPGVMAVSRSGDVAPEICETLDQMATMFVRAWAKRVGEPKPNRRGEGMDWDAQGFEPPDPPGDQAEDDSV